MLTDFKSQLWTQFAIIWKPQQHLTTAHLLPPSSQRDALLAGCGVGIITGAAQLRVALLGAQVKHAVAAEQHKEAWSQTVLVSHDFFWFRFAAVSYSRLEIFWGQDLVAGGKRPVGVRQRPTLGGAAVGIELRLGAVWCIEARVQIRLHFSSEDR